MIVHHRHKIDVFDITFFFGVSKMSCRVIEAAPYIAET